MAGGWVYIMANRPNGAFYVGVTSDPAKRIWEHRTGAVAGHTARYGLKLLVHLEEHAAMPLAIQREKTIKHWPRQWKVNLIAAGNPTCQDLFERYFGRE